LRSTFKMMAGAALVAALTGWPAAQAQTTRLGAIDMQGALLSTKDGQRAAEDLKLKFGPKEAELNKRNQDIIAKRDEYTKAAPTMSDDAKAATERDITAMTKNLQRDADDAKADFQAEEQRLLGGMMDKMRAVLDKYAAEHQITLIVDISSQPNNLLYADEASNVTKAVIAMYDQAPAPAAPAPAAAKPPAAKSPAASTPAPQRKTAPAPAAK